jgi:hypothetical protein
MRPNMAPAPTPRLTGRPVLSKGRKTYQVKRRHLSSEFRCAVTLAQHNEVSAPPERERGPEEPPLPSADSVRTSIYPLLRLVPPILDVRAAVRFAPSESPNA